MISNPTVGEQQTEFFAISINVKNVGVPFYIFSNYFIK